MDGSNDCRPPPSQDGVRQRIRHHVFFSLGVLLSLGVLFAIGSHRASVFFTQRNKERITLLSNEEIEGFNQYRPSSSQDTVQHKRKYHVFLSFRGPDTRKSFVDHLFQSLSTAGFHVFLDTERLEKGENIEISFEDAIRDSTVQIPIFSKNYARSVWCLRELSLIWTCKSEYPEITTIPLFYDVEPSVVRYQTGPYAKAFKELSAKGRYSPEEMDKWKKALRNVSYLSGWSLSLTANGYEGQLVKHVVMDLLQTLKTDEMPVTKHPVGLSGPMEKVKKLLEMDNHIYRVNVGIWGMGGLGKTTLSKALYNDVCRQFQTSCFVSNIRATARESVQGLVKLQRQILRDLVKVNEELNNIEQGIKKMETLLKSKKVLVILDDVDDGKQLDALFGDFYGPGSRIIITTRDKRVLKLAKIDNDKIHPMKGLSEDEGVQLFSWHTFLRACPDSGYEGITKKIVNACKGVPLSLEIVGAHLYGERRMEIWEEALAKIEEEVYPILKISYDALGHEAQQMFLDIACFFVSISNEYLNENLTYYLDIWKALGYKTVRTSLSRLEQKSLIRIDDSDSHCRIWMHDHLRDLGRKIVEDESPNDPSKRSRLWDKGDIFNVLQHTEEMPEVRGLMLTGWWELHQKVNLMPNLKFLCSEGVLRGVLVETEIKWLPGDLSYMVLSGGKILELSGQYCSLPMKLGWPSMSSLSRMIKLETLEMSSSFNIVQRLPNRMQSVREFRVYDLWDLEELPPLPKSLVHIKVNYLSLQQLSNMPMVKLETLHLFGCESLAELRELNGVQSLRELTLSYSKILKELPPLPESLVYIKVEGWDSLQKLPSMSHMIKLETLHVSSCKSLSQLPELKWMQSLRELRLSNCESLRELPPLPKGLLKLTLDGCKSLKELPPLPEGLIHLSTLGCHQLRRNASQPSTRDKGNQRKTKFIGEVMICCYCHQ